MTNTSLMLNMDPGVDSVVVISPYFWNFRDDMWQTTHHVAKTFAQTYPTVFVEPNVPWNPGSEQFRGHRISHSLVGPRTRSPRPNLVVFHRRGIPFGRLRAVREFDLSRNARALRQLLADLGVRRPLLWHSFPYWSEPLIEAVDHARFAYHCLDHSARDEELRLIRRADAVFCVSETLVQRHRAVNAHTYLLPNGVDLDLFSSTAASNAVRPRDLPAIGPLIGFAGSINYHLDLRLLVEVAERFPECSVILLGHVLSSETAPRGEQANALTRLRSLGNVHLLGFKPIEEVPAYVAAFNVCLIPFLDNPFNRERDPLKFYQYTAMGKPVVTTPLQLARRYPDLCYLASSPSEFVDAITRALTEQRRQDLVEARIAWARRHGWDSIVAEAVRLLASIPVAPLAGVARLGT